LEKKFLTLSAEFGAAPIKKGREEFSKMFDFSKITIIFLA
jgi:hypothetical protein